MWLLGREGFNSVSSGTADSSKQFNRQAGNHNGVPWQAHLAVNLRHAAHLCALLQVLVRGGAVRQQHRHDGGGQPAGCRSATGGGARGK